MGNIIWRWKRAITSLVSAFFHWIKKADFRGVSSDRKQPIAEVLLSTKWLKPKTIQRAKRNARYRAEAARWNLETAIFLNIVLILVIILVVYVRAGLILVTFTAVFGLAIVWLVGWRRERQLYPNYYYDELSSFPDEWKDYYKILKIFVSANFEDIQKAYQRLTGVYKEALSQAIIGVAVHSHMQKDIEEAFNILSDPIHRNDYDRVYWMKFNIGREGIDEIFQKEFLGLSDKITQQVEKTERVTKWRMPRVGKVAQQIVVGTAILLLAVGFGGTSFALAKPDYAIAAPFRGVAVTLVKTTVGAIELIEGARGITATQERKIVSTALQSMRIDESLQSVPQVIAPINDMAFFPSSNYCLFPAYLEKRYSQFRYTVDSYGNVVVDTSWSTTDSFINNMKKLIERLEKRE